MSSTNAAKKKKSLPLDSNKEGNNGTAKKRTLIQVESNQKKDSDSEVKNEIDEYDQEDDQEDEIILRAKWCLDGVGTIDEAIAKLNGFIRGLNHLKSEGYELRDIVEDDYGFLVKNKKN